MSIPCRLIDVLTIDGLRLHGAWHQPLARGPLTGMVVLTVHGVGGNFYSSHLFKAATHRLMEQGAHVLWTNNRGHDGWTSGPNGPRRGCGASFEQVADCRIDLAAWLQWCDQHLECEKKIYWGHSLGAIKSIYAATTIGVDAKAPISHASQAVSGVIASSPPLLAYHRLKQVAKGEQLIENVERAEQAIERGDDSLMMANYPFRLPITPTAYLDKYGPAENYDIVRLIPHVHRPLLMTYGELELSQPTPPFANAQELIESAVREDQDWSWSVIPKANHFYAQGSEELAETVERFLRETF